MSKPPPPEYATRRTCFGWEAAVYVKGVLRHVTDAMPGEMEALAAAREWAVGMGEFKLWAKGADGKIVRN